MATKAVTPPTTANNNALARAREVLKKALPNSDCMIVLDDQLLKESLPHLPSGSMVLDHLIGGRLNQHGVPPCPGIPKGKIFNLYGASSSGKTTLALTVAAEVCRKGGTVCYIDWENEIVPDYSAALGVPIGDPLRFQLVQPDTLEDGFKVMYAMATMGVDLIVIDSVGAGVPQAVFDQPLADQGKTGRIGLIAGSWSQFLPKFKGLINRTGTTVIGISQIRKNINTTGYGDDTVVQGGEAWKFWSALRIKLSRVAQEKRNEVNKITNKTEQVVYGAVVKAKIEKCKVSSSQGGEQCFYIKWGEGIDNIRSVLDVAIGHGIIKKGGAWYTWVKPDGEALKACGMDQLHKAVREAPALFDALYQATLPKLGSAVALQGTEDMVMIDPNAGLLEDLDDLTGITGVREEEIAAKDIDLDS